MAPAPGGPDRGGSSRDGPDVPERPDATLVRLPGADPPPPTFTAMCCVRAYREATGRTWYRVTTTPNVATDDPQVGRVRGALADALADVRAFLLDVGETPPASPRT